MSSYRQILYHILFATDQRKPTLDERYCSDLYQYICGIAKHRNTRIYQINGVADHIHILCDLHPSISLGNFVKEIKVATNAWMKTSGKFSIFEGWQDGYGAFTYSYKEKSILIRYIKNQKTHHDIESLEEEYRRLLKENGVAYDERYLF